MARLIDVEERDIEFIFGKANPYSLDVYQRDYRWSDTKDYKIVTQLLLDIELRFENNLKRNKRNSSSDLTSILNDVSKNFKPYFLNTIMLNEQNGNIFIVDGQQRLTTLLLILIKLYHLGKSDSEGLLNIDKVLGEKIYEEDLASVKHFKISNIDRNVIIKKIFEQEKITAEDIGNITQKNLQGNYNTISKYYDKYFINKQGDFDKDLFNYYVYNLISKVLIIEQVIKHQEDVAMIFETANDRGKELEPHEVLKGMLLGVLEDKIKENCNSIWNDALQTFFEKDGSYESVDDFFRTYFRAKYADNKGQYTQFSGKYHRNLLSNDKIIKDLDRNNPGKIEKFIKNDFVYFYKSYLEISRIAIGNKNIYVTSNRANEQGQQHLLVFSALIYNDPEKKEKISFIAKKLDQFYTISRLTGTYDSNNHQLVIYDINKAIRNKPLSEINDLFDEIIIKFFNDRGIPIDSFNDIFQFKYFENAKIDGQFTKYVLARVDRYLSDILNENSFAKQETLHFITHSGKKPKNGFHIEHMFSYNEKIMAQFKDENGEPDEKLFNDQRNKLGALLLLKGNENIRTSNNIYAIKKKSYSNSGFIWNRILTNSINQASLNSCKSEIIKKFRGYEPDENGLLTIDAIDERQKLLFEIIRLIYSN